MNNFDYLQAMRPFTSGYAQQPDQGQFHSPQGTQQGGLINSFCGLGGRGKTAPGNASSPAGGGQAQAPQNQISVPYRSNDVGQSFNPFAGQV